MQLGLDHHAHLFPTRSMLEQGLVGLLFCGLCSHQTLYLGCFRVVYADI